MRTSRKYQALAETTKTTEFMVGRSADEVLGRAQIYFSRSWPHTGDISRKRASVEFQANIRLRYGRLFMQFFRVVVRSLLTVGLYLLYWLLLKRFRLANHYHAEVFARDQDDGTLVRVDAGTQEYQKRLEEWVLQELGGQPIDG